MSARPRIAAALLCAAGLSGCSGDPETKVVDATAAEHGKALFRDPSIAGNSVNTYACSTCHAAIAGEAGDAILPGAPLAGAVDRPSYWGGQQGELLGAINDCLYFFMFKDEPWTADEEDAEAMYAYLQSLPADGEAKKAAPFTPVYGLVSPPAGEAARGDEVYGRACASCHGAAHTGAGRIVDRAPALPEETLEAHPLSTYTASERRMVFVEKIRHGGFVGYGGQMPPFSIEQLSEQDIGDLLTFFDAP